MSIRRVNPPELAPPVGFSHATIMDSGRLVLLAGQTALDSDGRVVGTSIVEQFEKVLMNLLTALTAAGGSPDHLAKLTIFCVDPGDYRQNAREIGTIWHRLVGREYPAMTLVGVTRLWDEEALIEIEGIAVVS